MKTHKNGFKRIERCGREFIVGTGNFGSIAFAHASELIFLNGRVRKFLDAVAAKKIRPQKYVFRKMQNYPELQVCEYFSELSMHEIRKRDGRLSQDIADAFAKFRTDWEKITNKPISSRDVVCLGRKDGKFVFTLVGLSDYYKTPRTRKKIPTKKNQFGQTELISATDIRQVMGDSPAHAAMFYLKPISQSGNGRKYRLTEFLDVIRRGKIEARLEDRGHNPLVIKRWLEKKLQILDDIVPAGN
jgi:hypothetical protein